MLFIMLPPRNMRPGRPMKVVLFSTLIVCGIWSGGQVSALQPLPAGVVCTRLGVHGSEQGRLAGEFGLRPVPPAGWVRLKRGPGHRARLPVHDDGHARLVFAFAKKDADNRFTPKLIGIVERVNAEIIDEESYLQRLKQLMVRSVPPYRVSRRIRKEKINNIKFSVLQTEREVAGIKILQKFYIRVAGKHILALVAVYTDQSQWLAVHDTLLKILHKE